MFIIGNDELENKQILGEAAKCPACNQFHEIEYGEVVKADGSREVSKLLSFISCNETDKMFLVGVQGKKI